MPSVDLQGTFKGVSGEYEFKCAIKLNSDLIKLIPLR